MDDKKTAFPGGLLCDIHFFPCKKQCGLFAKTSDNHQKDKQYENKREFSLSEKSHSVNLLYVMD
jgi:hypothetical protein